MKMMLTHLLNRIGYAQIGVLIGYLKKSGWIKSFRIGRPVDSAGNALPWYSYPAIHFLTSRTAKVNHNLRVFEFGSGNSTLWWANHASGVVSVEDNAKWHKIVSEGLPGNVSYILAEDKDSYIGAIAATSVPFDIVVIDGSHRNQCIELSVTKLSGNGVIIVDNSDWDFISGSITHLLTIGFRQLEFYGLAPANGYPQGTSIFYREENVFDI